LGVAAPPVEAPLVLIGREGRRRVVLAADMAALRAGLRVGMPVTKAQALVKGLIVTDAEPAADAEALERLALWTLRYAPIVAADPPDGLVIDTSGAAHIHGGEHPMVTAMAERLAASGIAAYAALADSWGAAHGFARFVARPVIVVSPGESAKAILDLPIVALRLPKDMVDALRVLGFERIGELVAKARAPLTLRFGPELGRRLDQATGRLSEPIVPVRPPDLIEVRRGFAEPIGAAETMPQHISILIDKSVLQGLSPREAQWLFHHFQVNLNATSRWFGENAWRASIWRR